MSRSRKGGCAVKSCPSRNDGRISFFRFPKNNLKRCREWLRLCSRDELFYKELPYFYNNLRVCGKHFEPSMFLNDLRNRLQPHAKPILHVATTDEPRKIEEAIYKIPEEIPVVYIPSVPSDVQVFFIYGYYSEPNHEENTSKSHAATQTPKASSHSTFRKRKLRLQCKEQQGKRAKTDFRSEAILSDLKELFKKHRPKGRRYTGIFSQYALQVYLTRSEAYKLLRMFQLPLVKTLHCTMNEFVFADLQIQALTSEQRTSAVMFDTMFIKASLFDKLSKDKVIGFHDREKEVKCIQMEFLTIVMVRGIDARWNEEVPFFVTNSNCCDNKLQRTVENMIGKLQSISGVNPIVVIGDRGSTVASLTHFVT